MARNTARLKMRTNRFPVSGKPGFALFSAFPARQVSRGELASDLRSRASTPAVECKRTHSWRLA